MAKEAATETGHEQERGSLAEYRRKRDFTKTAEPAPDLGEAREEGGLFVIQKHAARRLHYDLRLELDGVLKSWAVTRGPSLDPQDKRLAVEVEDHPLAYADFEGEIPEGEYGAGHVIVWDRGRWEPDGDPHAGLAKGHLEFALHGEKLGGCWHLVRLKPRGRERRINWLLMKAQDEAAREPGMGDILDERPESVMTGETLPGDVAVSDASPRKGRARSKKQATGGRDKPPRGAVAAELPAFLPPALATLVPRAPAGSQWLHEIKFDGYRLEARIERGEVRLLTRTGLDWTHRFGHPVVEALNALPVETALFDGEIVVENAAGASDFSLLQQALSAGNADAYRFYLFDVMHLDGFDLTGLPLVARKEALARVVPEPEGEGVGVVRLSGHFDADGARLLRHACRLSLEGVVSKRRNAPYLSGRGKDWLKSKCAQRQEFVIGGYVPSSTGDKAIGSLVMGHYDGDRLVHAGRVGTGFSAEVAHELFRRLEELRQDKRPFDKALTSDQARGVRYVRPELVAEVEFRGWTHDRSLRHAAFRGLREDKPAREVVSEMPQADAAPNEAAEPQAFAMPAVRLTHPDRLLWPDAGVTKEGLAAHYTAVWPRIAPFVVARPLSLVRCPDGIAKACFFQKHAWKGLSRAIRQVPDPLEPDAPALIAIDSLEGLIGLVQANVLEIHPWGASLEALEAPDLVVIDLDPGENVPWSAIVAGAREARERLTKAGLNAFLKTSGGKGLHVVAPLAPQAGWDAVKDFARDIAHAMAKDSPRAYVATTAKDKR
jgi:bifunctional non-homologous end joining protein LigD